VARKVGRAIWAFVTLRRRRFRRVLAIPRKTHLTSWGAWVGFWRQRPREREGAIAWVIARIWRNELMVMLLVMLLWWLLLGRTFAIAASDTCTSVHSRNTRGIWGITIAETRHAGWTRLHVVARHAGILIRDDERLRGLVGLGDVHLYGALRGFRGVAHGLAAPVQTLQCRNSGIGARLPRRLFPEAALISKGSGSRERLGGHPGREAAR
jgi:hypothetical protein